MCKEQDLNRKGECRMEHNHHDKEGLAGLAISSTEHGVKISQEERARDTEAHSDKYPVEDKNRRPRDECNGNPNEICIAVQGPALE
jgi:hypothetical protein